MTLRRFLAFPFRWLANKLDPPCIWSFQIGAGVVHVDGEIVQVPLATVTVGDYEHLTGAVVTIR